MYTFVSTNFLRRAGLVVSLAMAAVTALSGDFITAGGIAAAALSTAGLKKGVQPGPPSPL